MSKTIITFISFFLATTSFAQKYYTSSATITFTSEAPAEKIISTNKQVTCLLNITTNEIAFKVIIKSFQFSKQGIYDHFNHDYTESDKFPNATFLGKFTQPTDLTKSGSYSAMVEGDLSIHGVTKHIKQAGKLDIAAGKISLQSSFNILLSDYGIKVPNDFVKRISNMVQLEVNATLTPYAR